MSHVLPTCRPPRRISGIRLGDFFHARSDSMAFRYIRRHLFPREIIADNHIIRTKKWNPCRKYDGMFATGPIACAAALAPSTASTPPHHAKYVFFDPGMSGSSRKKSIRRISVAIRAAVVTNPTRRCTITKSISSGMHPPAGPVPSIQSISRVPKSAPETSDRCSFPSLNRSDHPQTKNRSTTRIPQGGLGT